MASIDIGGGDKPFKRCYPSPEPGPGSRMSPEGGRRKGLQRPSRTRSGDTRSPLEPSTFRNAPLSLGLEREGRLVLQIDRRLVEEMAGMKAPRETLPPPSLIARPVASPR